MKEQNQKTISDIPQMIKDIKLSNFPVLASMCWRLVCLVTLITITIYLIQEGKYLIIEEVIFYTVLGVFSVVELKSNLVSKTLIKFLKG
ncbi:hypothetical protein GNP79_06955 [Aliivibrio fischeri]|uniref:Uncharacterized protein n=1 Tax=Aliivibrio fischeri TaxID=668 RepID=A0A6N3Z620_ALIFS|nr:hypothetical protein [Aliivibrio fischeri]MUK44883.1 hypothetical protein [Aliivibrio fischeri]MUK80542.1 hypothetical protein [Aliivibrio fischeri]MUK84449.1 hypothetical protein [Aliivibrio fischeri]